MDRVIEVTRSVLVACVLRGQSEWTSFSHPTRARMLDKPLFCYGGMDGRGKKGKIKAKK